MTMIEKWAELTRIEIPRYSLERAVLALDRIEALALIRAAYSCNVHEAQEIHEAIKRHAR